MGSRAEDAVRRDERQRIGAGDGIEIILNEQHVIPAAAGAQRRTGIGHPQAGGFGNAEKYVIEGLPGERADDAVRRKALHPLEGADRVFGGRSEDAVDFDGRHLLIIHRDDPQQILRQTHLAAGTALPQQIGGPLAGQGDILTAQLRQPQHRRVDVGDLVPGGGPYDAVGREIEDALEGADRRLGLGGKGSIHIADGGNGRIVAADAVELRFQRAHRFPGAADPERAARIGGADGPLLRGGGKLDIAAVVIAQDAERRVAVVGQRNGAPLGEPFAGDGGAVAVLGKQRIEHPLPADVLVVDLIHDAADIGKNIAPVHEVLVVVGIIGDIEIVALAGIPFGKNAVLSKGDLRKDIGPQGVFRPGGVDLAGGDVFDVIPEADGDIAGGGIIGRAQMHRDIGGDEHPRQRHNIPRKALRRLLPHQPQTVGGNIDLLGWGHPRTRQRNLTPRSGVHFHRLQRLLPRKDLNAGDLHRQVALRFHEGIVCTVRQLGAVRHQAPIHRRRRDAQDGGASAAVGSEGMGLSVGGVGNGNAGSLHRQGLPRGGKLEKQGRIAGHGARSFS